MIESIELVITVNGTTYPVRCQLPSVLKASNGPMSIRSAIEPAVLQLLDRMVEILDLGMKWPRVVTQEVGRDLKPSA